MDGSTFTTLNPPDHIKGNLHRFIPQETRDERDKWCADMRMANMLIRQIADALGIHKAQAHKASIRGGYRKPMKPVTPEWLRNHGQKMGHGAHGFAKLDNETQRALVLMARRKRCTVMQAAFDVVQEAMKKDHPGVK